MNLIYGDSHVRRLQLRGFLKLFKGGRKARSCTEDTDWPEMMKRVTTAENIVIVLGSNDVECTAHGERIIESLQNVCNKIRAVSPTVRIFVTDFWRRSSYSAGQIDIRLRVNSLLTKTKAEILRVAKLIRPNHLGKDGVHLNGSGNDVLRKAILDAVPNSRNEPRTRRKTIPRNVADRKDSLT